MNTILKICGLLLLAILLFLAGWWLGQLQVTPTAVCTGSLRVVTEGENTTDPGGSAPAVSVGINEGPPKFRVAIAEGVNPGTQSVYTEFRPGLTVSVGFCRTAEGGGDCTPGDFTEVTNCDDSRCRAEAEVLAGAMTRVVFRHEGRYEGWGAQTPGGKNGKILPVTNLNPSGSGSLRQALIDACNQNNRYIVFRVSGKIVLPHTDKGGVNNSLKVCGNRITVDGFTAPDPGITVTQYGLNIHVTGPGGVSDPKDTHDLILRGFRLRKNGYSGANCDGASPDDCELQVVNIETGASSYNGPYRVHDLVIDHMSISGGRDDMIGISRGSYNLTLSWNLISNGFSSNQGYLMDSSSYQVSMHHNRWSTSARRNPQITYHNVNPGSTNTSTPPTISADIRANTIVEYKENAQASHWGALIAAGAKANIINNYFTADATLANDSWGPNNAIITCNPGSRWMNGQTMNTCDFCNPGNDPCQVASDTFVDGNFIDEKGYGRAPSMDMNALDVNVDRAITSPTITMEVDAAAAACVVRERAGARPLDNHDAQQDTRYRNPCG